MPISNTDQVATIQEAIIMVRPETVLDVGCGFGLYGYLCRHWAQHQQRELTLEGIEVYEKYIGDLQKNIYQKIHIGEALNILVGIDQDSYDLVMAIDILEHFSREEGYKFIAELRRVGKNVIISTPKLTLSQGADFGNTYEIHKSQWKKVDFPGAVFMPQRRALIACIGPAFSGYKAKSDTWPTIVRLGMRLKRMIKPFKG